MSSGFSGGIKAQSPVFQMEITSQKNTPILWRKRISVTYRDAGQPFKRNGAELKHRYEHDWRFLETMNYIKTLDQRLLDAKRELTIQTETLIHMLRGVPTTIEHEKQIEKVMDKMIELIKTVNDICELKRANEAAEK